MTIDQRATSYIAENEYTEKEACIAYAAYCAGAREQKSFDTEKACKALYGVVGDFCDVRDIDKIIDYLCTAIKER